MYTWKRFGGYDCSSKGDARFSAFTARLSDGRTIEHHYQCDVKGYDPGGTDWRLGKGKRPLNKDVDLWDEYLGLWKRWAENNRELMEELMVKAQEFHGVLSDRFAVTPINQAHALSIILNHMAKAKKEMSR